MREVEERDGGEKEGIAFVPFTIPYLKFQA
jgi:hypothetical protein